MNALIKNYEDMSDDELRQTVAALRKKAARSTSKKSPYKGWLAKAQTVMRERNKVRFRELISKS
jgi:hypothetical protein